MFSSLLHAFCASRAPLTAIPYLVVASVARWSSQQLQPENLGPCWCLHKNERSTSAVSTCLASSQCSSEHSGVVKDRPPSGVFGSLPNNGGLGSQSRRRRRLQLSCSILRDMRRLSGKMAHIDSARLRIRSLKPFTFCRPLGANSVRAAAYVMTFQAARQ